MHRTPVGGSGGLLAAAAGALSTCVVLSVLVGGRVGAVLRVDGLVGGLVQRDVHQHGRAGRAVAEAVSWSASLPVLAVVVAVVAVLLRVVRRSWVESVVLLASFVCAVLSVNIIKAVVGRPRPGLVDLGVPFAQSDLSFPSGHVTDSSVLLTVSVLLLPGGPRGRVRRFLRWLVVLGVEGVIAWSRLGLGEHWLSDVVAGFLLGTGIACAASVLDRRLAASRHDREARA